MFGNLARSRLLPMSVPFRYFGAAAAFQLCAWLALLAASGDWLSFSGGLGLPFAALHLVTLGVLVMAAMGASLQLLPVATRQPVVSVAAAKLAWWLYAPGVAVLAAGAALYAPRAMGAGATLAVAGFVLYVVLLFRNLVGARGLRTVVSYAWGALACLVALAATGIALVARYEHGLEIDYPAVRSAHLVLAAYGFMGLLALGLSNFLLPMLALSPSPPPRVAYAVLGGAVAAIVFGAVGFTVVASIIGLTAATTHIVSLERSLRARLRKPLGPAFVLIRVSWGCLLASLACAAAIALGLAPDGAPLAFGLLLVPGWLLTFLLGVLQRILPFLGSVHASTGARGTPLISALTPARMLVAHGACHLAALACLLAALWLGSAALARAGAGLGLSAALLYAAFFSFVLFKIRHHGIEPPHQPATA